MSGLVGSQPLLSRCCSGSFGVAACLLLPSSASLAASAIASPPECTGNYKRPPRQGVILAARSVYPIPGRAETHGHGPVECKSGFIKSCASGRLFDPGKDRLLSSAFARFLC